MMVAAQAARAPSGRRSRLGKLENGGNSFTIVVNDDLSRFYTVLLGIVVAVIVIIFVAIMMFKRRLGTFP